MFSPSHPSDHRCFLQERVSVHPPQHRWTERLVHPYLSAYTYAQRRGAFSRAPTTRPSPPCHPPRGGSHCVAGLCRFVTIRLVLAGGRVLRRATVRDVNRALSWCMSSRPETLSGLMGCAYSRCSAEGESAEKIRAYMLFPPHVR